MNAARNALIVQLYKSGKTIGEIGAQFGFTRERARQIIRSAGVSRRDGGMAKRCKVYQIVEARADDLCRNRLGITLDERRSIRREFGPRPFRAFSEHRQNANRRKIQFLMTFREWWAIWKESGKWELCGKHSGKFVMSRFGDAGPYAVWNVRIITCNDNHAEHKRLGWLKNSGVSTFIARNSNSA